MNEDRNRVRGSQSGFTLLEAVVGAALLVVLAAGTLHSTSILRAHSEIMQGRRQSVVRKWNKSRRLRLERTPAAETLEPAKGGRTLYRHRIAEGRGLPWEVWVGEF